MFMISGQIRMTIGLKIYALIGLSFLGLMGLASLDIHEIAATLRHQKIVELQHLTDLALAIIKEEYTVAQKGEISEAEAQQRALARTATLRYGNNDYFFILDMNARMLMQPISVEIVGKSMLERKDASGKLAWAEMVDVVRRESSGFVDFMWPKPGSDVPSPKLAYVVGFTPWGWVVSTGVYVDDLDAQTWIAARRSLIAATLVLVLTLAVSAVVAGRIKRPLHEMTDVMKQIAGGRLNVDVPGTDRRDEIGEMAAAVEIFKSNAVARIGLETEREEAETRAAALRRADMHRLADSFELAVGQIVERVSSASSQLELSASSLSSTAERAEGLATTVAAASSEASSNVQSVASATEEMTSSITEISRRVQESARIAGEAVGQARATNDRVGELSMAATRIGDVVDLINTIAGQTNLLALNATIEAARAGDAGRGFAVVAAEVKALAEQTAKATGEIAQQINGIQGATRESVTAIREISSTISRLSEISAAIAAAVEEQGVATQEIASNVHQTACGTQLVSSNISEVQRGASDTERSSAQVLKAAQSLSTESGHLRQEVDSFLSLVRSA